MRATGRRIAACVAAVALAMALSAPAASGDGGAKTRVVMKKLNATGAAGRVTSARDSCIDDRKISLFVLDGFITDKVAITYTNRRGEWRIARNLKEGAYFAKVDSRKGCRYDNSRRKQLKLG